MMLDFHALNAEATRRLAVQSVGPVKHEDASGLTAKQKLRADIERQTRAFIRAGGKVKQADGPVTFPWPAGRDASQLVTIANFAYQSNLTQFEVFAASRRGDLTIWVHRGDQCLLRSKAVAWQRARHIASTAATA